MTDQALEKLTRQIMLDAVRLEYGSLLEGAPEHTFSPAFERKMKKLLRRGRHPVLYRTLRAAACLLLVLLLSGCAVLVVSPAAREVFLGWVREFRTPAEYPPYTLYTYSGKEEGGNLFFVSIEGPTTGGLYLTMNEGDTMGKAEDRKSVV